MAAPVTLEQLRKDTLLFAADGQQGALDEGYLDRLINQRLAMLYDKLVEARGETYYHTGAVINVLPNVSAYAMPADFYQLASLTLIWSAGDAEEVTKLVNLGDLARYASLEWGPHAAKAYYFATGQLQFTPIPSSAVTCSLLYVPICPTLSDDMGTFDGVNGWDRAVSLGAAIDYLTVQRLPTGHLAPLYQEQIERIERMATERDITQAHQVRDVFPEQRATPWWPRSRA
jgi:hypothetical protein